MLYQKIRTKFNINYENLLKITIEGSKTPQNEKTRPMVHTIAPKIGWETSKKIKQLLNLPKLDALSDETY